MNARSTITGEHLSERTVSAGVNSHDTRIVAAMLRHGIPTLLTTDARDFSKYAEIEVLTPEIVLAGTADQ